MTNSLELLRLADSLDRQGFYRLAQEAEESAQEQAASQQESKENTSDFYGLTGNTAELYSAYNYLRQLVNLGFKSQYFQQIIVKNAKKIESVIENSRNKNIYDVIYQYKCKVHLLKNSKGN